MAEPRRVVSPPSTPATPVGNPVRWIAGTPGRAFLVIFLLALAIGLSMLPFVPRAAIVPHTNWEVEAVAVLTGILLLLAGVELAHWIAAPSPGRAAAR